MNPSPDPSGRLKQFILRDEVYEYLRRQIITLQYPPGFRFDLNKLEKELGISRTPLNVALYRLEMEGLVKVRPRRGTYVTPLNKDEIAENFDVRLMLEQAAAEVVLAKATDHELAQLLVIHAQMNNLLDSGPYDAVISRYIDLDYKLHVQYMSYARNKQLMRIYTRLNTHLQIARLQQKFARTGSHDTQAEHETIITALPGRDVAALKAALGRHIINSKARTLAALI